ncbi:lipoprotein insertase outer membrane protein LolB [Cellvibrio japonicus]|uniref:Outer-membrane lipoprotein LolB n=1 Tax=Cellvibrio japonicus (strain Ueda107) TaxID=498211 RepID=LOLB_CELJU|nr:lipoprotein insertase outer membrane protein LolB [Cellvibrio japonicus]B3PJN9.1 RecName: Full=Outer-membrane lipoprotein LolB; Flags: Precursor [Cellvibrio japonicus Ueda107]ACE85412.1 outer membrane lipoprotein LolB [Cellvibrio japonicus Ueda107]QEI11321.1 outer membrane lipoprotein LolB [Cellvibrio japonicus]QEI14895.1 outer membrane lipoprotein LolB [Cellvibrio japonicus]QEI18475.1 outer membrane lipoprotein LolB [Cellvibrio japonicus]
MYRLLCLLALLTAAGLMGCASQRGLTPPPDLQAHQQQLQAVASWQIDGKLGIRSPQESGSATLKWQQQPDNYQIYLSGPLGQKRLQIIGAPAAVTLLQSGQPPMHAQSAESLIKKAAGWTLPVSQLSYWVRGLPAPKTPITGLQLSPQGLISELQQANWTIHYSNYRDYYHGETRLALPGKIQAEYRDLRLTLVIRDWQLGIH